MHWRSKALIQQGMALLPRSLSNPAYFRLQRHFGNLHRSRIDPTSKLRIGFEICRHIARFGKSPVGATFFEIGTGWRLNVPIACWLCGADRVVTVDLNSLLSGAIISEDLLFFRRNEQELFNRLRSEFGDLILADRWRRLIQLAAADLTIAEVCDVLHIEYVAPADAAQTHCDSQSIDFHISCNVLEHISEELLGGIFREARRITRPSGLLVHRVDHSDHFSHADRALPAIHFLRYDDTQWNRYAGNRYAYVNRLREDDYLHVFRGCGLAVGTVSSEPDETVVRLLQDGCPIHGRFRGKTHDTLARLKSLFVLMPDTTIGTITGA